MSKTIHSPSAHRTAGAILMGLALSFTLGTAGCGTGTIHSHGDDVEDAWVPDAVAPVDVDHFTDGAVPADAEVSSDAEVFSDAEVIPDAAVINADFCETGQQVVLEAESFTTQNGYSQVPRTDASGGMAMQVGASGSLDFEIHLATGGTYYFWIRTLAADSESNGIFVALDGSQITAPPSNPYAGVPDIFLYKSATQWFWEPLFQGSGSGAVAGPVIFTTSAGVHTLSIQKRKMERPLIDKIVLTTGNTQPSGLGPAETPCP